MASSSSDQSNLTLQELQDAYFPKPAQKVVLMIRESRRHVLANWVRELTISSSEDFQKQIVVQILPDLIDKLVIVVEHSKREQEIICDHDIDIWQYILLVFFNLTPGRFNVEINDFSHVGNPHKLMKWREIEFPKMIIIDNGDLSIVSKEESKPPKLLTRNPKILNYLRFKEKN